MSTTSSSLTENTDSEGIFELDMESGTPEQSHEKFFPDTPEREVNMYINQAKMLDEQREKEENKIRRRMKQYVLSYKENPESGYITVDQYNYAVYWLKKHKSIHSKGIPIPQSNEQKVRNTSPFALPGFVPIRPGGKNQRNPRSPKNQRNKEKPVRRVKSNI